MSTRGKAPLRSAATMIGLILLATAAIGVLPAVGYRLIVTQFVGRIEL